MKVCTIKALASAVAVATFVAGCCGDAEEGDNIDLTAQALAAAEASGLKVAEGGGVEAGLHRLLRKRERLAEHGDGLTSLRARLLYADRGVERHRLPDGGRAVRCGG